MPKIAITILTALIYFIDCAESNNRFWNRAVLEKGTHPQTVFGFEKIGENDGPERLVHVATSYDIKNLPYVTVAQK